MAVSEKWLEETAQFATAEYLQPDAVIFLQARLKRLLKEYRIMQAEKPDEPEPLLTPAEVSVMLGVDPKTVTRWASSGKLQSIRTPGRHRRFRYADIKPYLQPEFETHEEKK